MPRLEVRSGHRISKIAGGGGGGVLVACEIYVPCTCHPFPGNPESPNGYHNHPRARINPRRLAFPRRKNIQNVGPQSTNHCISVDVHVSVQRHWDNIAYYRGLNIYQYYFFGGSLL